MKKTLLLIIILSSAAVSSFGQTQSFPQLSIGPEAGLPSGVDQEAYSTVIGASLKLDIPVKTSPLHVVFTAGYEDFIVKSIYKDTILNAQYIPVEAGLKYFVDPNVYFEADAGASFNVNSNYSGGSAGFIYAPSLGIAVPLSAKNGLDFNIRYEARVESEGSIKQVALRIAYSFGL
jgi:hypothetical protein